MNREFVGLATLIGGIFLVGIFTLLSFAEKVQQQQADLEMSLAAMNKNRVQMKLFMKAKSKSAPEGLDN